MIETVLRSVRTIDRDDDPIVPALARLLGDAYPRLALHDAAALERNERYVRANISDNRTRYAVIAHDDDLAGAIRLHDFRMRVRSTTVFAGGVGSVAVSPIHKREGVATRLLDWYLAYYRDRRAIFALLYPFRFGFYRRLGFGYGSPVYRYRLATAILPLDSDTPDIRYLVPSDAPAVMEFLNRTSPRANGSIEVSLEDVRRMLTDGGVRWIGSPQTGPITAIMQTSAAIGERGTSNTDELVVRSLIHESAAGLRSLLSYVSRQTDQFAYTTFETVDAALYSVGDEPHDGSNILIAKPIAHRVAEAGLGVMYRILDVPGALACIQYSDRPLRLRVNVDDPSFGATNGTWTIACDATGSSLLTADDPADATVSIGIHDLSSIVMGALRIEDAVRYGRAMIEPTSALELVAKYFRCDEPPFCMAHF